MLVFQNVIKKYNMKKVVLNRCNFTVGMNKVFGLLGENGAGKTTILRLIAGILKQDSGTIRFFDEVIFENVKLKQDIVFISDEMYFPARATLHKMKQHYEIFYPNFKIQRYYELIQLFKLDEHENVHTFSKGLKRQAALVLGLAIESKLLLLDEIFDGLDIKARYDVKKYMTKLMENNEMSIIIASHNLTELELLCDEIALVEDASIKVHKNIDQLKSNVYKVNIIYKDKLVMDLDTMYHESNGKIQTFIVKGNLEEIEAYLETLDCVFKEVLPCTLEEVFVFGMKGDTQHASV